MRYFLLTYDRRAGTLVDLREFKSGERSQALAARFETELRYAADSSVEVVVLGARSLDDLHRTHGRYFRSLQDLAAATH